MKAEAPRREAINKALRNSTKSLAAAVVLLGLFAGASPALGQDDDSKLKALRSQWGKIVSTYGEPAEALRVAKEYLALAEKLYGPDSKQVALALQALGQSYSDLKDSGNALSAFRRSLAIYEKLGIHDENACEAQYQLARETKEVSEALARNAAGLSCYGAIYSLGKKEIIDYRLGDTIAAYRFHLNIPGAADTSEQIVQHWLPIVQKQLGPKDILAAQLLDLQSRVLAARNDTEGARTIRRRAITLAENDSDASLIVSDWLEDALKSYNQDAIDAEYMGYAAERAELLVRQWGPTHRDAVAARELLIKARIDHPAIAVPPLSSDRSVTLDPEFLKTNEEGERLSSKAHSDGALSLYKTAIAFDEKLLAATEERYGPFSLEAAAVLQRIGNNDRLYVSRPGEEAESYLARSLTIYERQGRLSWSEACYSRMYLGMFYANIESWGKHSSQWMGDHAVEWYGAAMDCLEKNWGPGSATVLSLSEEYIKILRQTHPDKAALLERQLELKRQKNGEWQRIFASAAAARKPIASVNLDALIRQIPAVKPDPPVQTPSTPTQRSKAPVTRKSTPRKK